MAISGEPLPHRQARVEADLRAAGRTTLVLFALSTIAAAAILTFGWAARSDVLAEQQDEVTQVRGRVLDGRGTTPDSSELLVQYPSSGGGTDQRWMRVSNFYGYEAGTAVTVAHPAGRPQLAQIADECDCLPSSGPPIPIFAVVLLLGAAFGVGFQLWSQLGRRSHAPEAPVLAWWADPRSSVLRLYHPTPAPGSGHQAGPMVGTMHVPFSYRSIIADGDTLVLAGSVGLRGASLSTAAGPLVRRLALSKPSSSTKAARALRGPTWLASLGRSKEPIEAHEGRRLDLALATASGLSPLLALWTAWTLPAPWTLAVLLAPVPLIVGYAGTLWARLGAEDDLDARAARDALIQRGVLSPQVAAPPPPPPPSELIVSAPKGRIADLGVDGRSGEASSHWFSSRFSTFTALVCSLACAAAAPILLALPIVAGALFWRRSPRPIVKRYYRPALPPWGGLFSLSLATTGWYQAVDGDGTGTVPAARVLGMVVFVVLTIAAVRIATLGLTVGRDEWVVRSLFSTTRISAASIIAVERRPKRWIVPSAGVVIHRRMADPLIVPRLTLSVPVARRMVRDYERATILPQTPPDWVSTPPSPLIPSPYGRTF